MNFNKILIAIDGNLSSESVALSGLQLAQQYHAEIALISVVNPETDFDSDPPTSIEVADMMEHNCNKIQLKLIEKVFKLIPITSFIEKGSPYKAIIRVAEQWGADIIVMGTHGRKGLPHFIMGSVAEEVIRHSKKTVVVIPVTDSSL